MSSPCREYMHKHSKKNLPDLHIVFDQCHIYTCSAHMANLPCDKDNHGRLHSSAWFYKRIYNHKNFYLVLHQLVHVHLLLLLVLVWILQSEEMNRQTKGQLKGEPQVSVK